MLLATVMLIVVVAVARGARGVFSFGNRDMSGEISSLQFSPASTLVAAISRQFTVEAWVFATSAAECAAVVSIPFHRLTDRWNPPYVALKLGRRCSGFEWQLELQTQQCGFCTVPCGGTLELNRWEHVAVVFDGSAPSDSSATFQCYVNGAVRKQLSRAVACPGCMFAGNLDANFLGCSSADGCNLFVGRSSVQVDNENINGFVGEVRVWRSVRSAQQIADGRHDRLRVDALPSELAVYLLDSSSAVAATTATASVDAVGTLSGTFEQVAKGTAAIVSRQALPVAALPVPFVPATAPTVAPTAVPTASPTPGEAAASTATAITPAGFAPTHIATTSTSPSASMATTVAGTAEGGDLFGGNDMMLYVIMGVAATLLIVVAVLLVVVAWWLALRRRRRQPRPSRRSARRSPGASLKSRRASVSAALSHSSSGGGGGGTETHARDEHGTRLRSNSTSGAAAGAKNNANYADVSAMLTPPTHAGYTVAPAITNSAAARPVVHYDSHLPTNPVVQDSHAPNDDYASPSSVLA